MEFTRIRVLESTFALVRRAISNIIEYNDNNPELPLEDELIDGGTLYYAPGLTFGLANDQLIYVETISMTLGEGEINE